MFAFVLSLLLLLLLCFIILLIFLYSTERDRYERTYVCTYVPGIVVTKQYGYIRFRRRRRRRMNCCVLRNPQLSVVVICFDMRIILSMIST